TVSQAHRQAESALKSLESQGFFASIPEQDAPLIVFGGPDGVLLRYDSFHQTTLKESILYQALIGLLEAGKKIVLISDQRYYDYVFAYEEQTTRKDTETIQVTEKGLFTRIVEAIPQDLRKNLTIYACSGAFKVEFDEYGQEKTDNDYNRAFAFESNLAGSIKEDIERIIEEYWKDYQANPEVYRNMYPAYTFRRPQVILNKGRLSQEERIYAINIIYLPSDRLPNNLTPENQDYNVRKSIIQRIKEELATQYPYIWDHYQIEEKGITSIDIHRKDVSKSNALKFHIRKNQIQPEGVAVFGNTEFYSRDRELLEAKGINAFNNSQESIGARLNKGLGGIYYACQQLSRESVQGFRQALSQTRKNFPEALQAALDYIQTHIHELNDRPLLLDKINWLKDIYDSFDLTYIDYPSWTALYLKAFEAQLLANVKEALEEYIGIYKQKDTIEDLWREADQIAKEKNIDNKNLFAYYSGIDPRAAKHSEELKGIYAKANRFSNLISDIRKTAQTLELSITRVLASYYQDTYYLSYKKSLLAETIQKQAPPDYYEAVYLGGGGKATTTLLQEFVNEEIKNIACIISNSDDGGDSEKIMYSLFRKLGIFFIPAGDAAGLNIFLSNDNFKILTLFWMESEKDKLQEEKDKLPNLTTIGRITSDSLYSSWRKRIEEVLVHRDAIAKVLNIQIQEPEDKIIFLTGILSLAELMDREFVEKGILRLNNTSTPNLILIGDAYDTGLIGLWKKPDIRLEQPRLKRLLGLTEQEPIVVGSDYEHSALLAVYEGGDINNDKDVVRYQTIITDRAHDRKLFALYFCHRPHIGRIKRLDIDAPAYPPANPQATEALEKAKRIIMGNGSLWTSLLPVLLYKEVAQTLVKKKQQGTPVIYIAKIKSDLENAVIDVENPIQEEDGEYYLKIEKQLTLREQLEAIRRHVARVLGKDVELNQIISHVIVPELTKETVKTLGYDLNTGESLIKLESKSQAKELKRALKEGKAQVSKLLKGIQPPVTEEDKQWLEEQGIEVIEIEEKDIIDIDNKGKPLYSNKRLYKEIMEISASLTTINAACSLYSSPKSRLPLRVMYLRNNTLMHAFQLYLNPAYSKEELARYVLYEVYNRLSIFGAEEILVDVDSGIYEEFIKLFNTPLEFDKKNKPKGYLELGSFMNIVYELPDNKQFRIRHVSTEEFNRLKEATPVYEAACRDFTKLAGTYLGIDIGGSDIKIVVLQDGGVVYSYKENWTPESFSEAGQHMDYILRLIDRALQETALSLQEINSLGISFNLVVVNNRPTGLGPVVNGLKAKEEIRKIKDIALTLQERLNIPVFILNDGDAGALWAAVRENAPNALALALGTGLAGGYADEALRIRDYLTEMGNVVLSLEEEALKHSFSKVLGAAQMYLSQRLAFELAETQGIDLSSISEKAEKLEHLQRLFDAGEEKAVYIFTQIGRYLADYIVYINTILPVENVYLFGRVLKGESGKQIVSSAKQILTQSSINITLSIPEDVEFAQAEGAAIYAAGMQKSATYLGELTPKQKEAHRRLSE
ncbi:MAG: hypothetical protein DRJ18_02425, partial [Candidatus Methanomethylicota archaeon]